MDSKKIALERNLVISYIAEMEDIVKKEINNGVTRLVLDFAHVNIVDSSGIGFLVKIQNTLDTKEGKLEITNLNETVKRMFKMMNLNRHFSF